MPFKNKETKLVFRWATDWKGILAPFSFNNFPLVGIKHLLGSSTSLYDSITISFAKKTPQNFTAIWLWLIHSASVRCDKPLISKVQQSYHVQNQTDFLSFQKRVDLTVFVTREINKLKLNPLCHMNYRWV